MKALFHKVPQFLGTRPPRSLAMSYAGYLEQVASVWESTLKRRDLATRGAVVVPHGGTCATWGAVVVRS